MQLIREKKSLNRESPSYKPWQAARLKQVIAERYDGNASKLARACERVDGRTYRSHVVRLSKYLNRTSTPGLDAAIVIGQAAAVSLDWLAGGDVPQGATGQGGVDRVMIPLASVSASAGDGADPFEAEIADYISYNRSWIQRQIGIDPARLAVISVTGTSMQPTLLPGDRLLVARHNGEPIRDSATYVLRHRYTGVSVKRLHQGVGGVLQIRGDNDKQPVDTINPEADDQPWTIVARVLSYERVL